MRVIAKEEVPVLKIDLTKWKGILVQLIAGIYKHNTSDTTYWIKYQWGSYISKEGEVFFDRPGVQEFFSAKKLMSFIHNERDEIEQQLKKFKVNPSNHIDHL